VMDGGASAGVLPQAASSTMATSRMIKSRHVRLVWARDLPHRVFK
jgi:hypothetical protein